jgi:hypothetical protein
MVVTGFGIAAIGIGNDPGKFVIPDGSTPAGIGRFAGRLGIDPGI